MRIRYTAEAQADLATIYEYLEARSPQAALRIKTAIQQVITGLADFPEVGPAADIEGVRVLLAGRFPTAFSTGIAATKSKSYTSDTPAAVHGRAKISKALRLPPSNNLPEFSGRAADEFRMGETSLPR